MKLSVTAVTRDRSLAKAIIRCAPMIADLKRQLTTAWPSAGTFDVLQVVLVDKPYGHVALQGTHSNDGLCQIHVGFAGVPTSKGTEDMFVERLTESLRTLSTLMPISVAEATILGAVTVRKDEER